MGCHCHIIPQDVLKRLSEDKSLSTDERATFADTARIDVEFRALRDQAAKLAAVAERMALTPEALALNPNPRFPIPIPIPRVITPKVTVYTCNHSQSLPGQLIASPGSSADPTVKNAYNTTRALADFYRKIFKRKSIDDANLGLISSTHYGNNYNNAFWNGSQMTYGDGDGKIFVDFTKGNDVIGHEITHGVTQHTLKLLYADEAGGLNESMSDVFGSMFRQWQAGQTVTQADWLIGKDIMGPTAIGKGLICLRDMASPGSTHCLAPQPTKYSQITPTMDPHYSSGPPNLAFCNAAKAAGGKSWEKVGQVWYKALTGFGPTPNMKMKDFANRTRTVAGQLYPGTPAIAAAVDKGWKSVGL